MEAASEFEAEVNTWLDELPAPFRTSARTTHTAAPSAATSPDPSGGGATIEVVSDAELSPYTIAQRSELAAMANSLILKAYTPILKKSISNTRSSSSTASHTSSLREAQLACSTAAHVIINACHTLFNAFGQSRPSSYVFYSFGRQIFAAAAVCASIVIQTPMSLVAEPAMRDLERALELMRNPIVLNARGYVGVNKGKAAQNSAESQHPLPSSSLHIVQLLHGKAKEALDSGGTGGAVSSSSGIGTKRKHGELDSSADSSIPQGFQIPFVGSALVTGPSGLVSSTSFAPVLPARGSSPPPPPAKSTRLRSSTNGGIRRGGGTASAASNSEAGDLTPSVSAPSRVSPSTMAPPEIATSAPVATRKSRAGSIASTTVSTATAAREKHRHPAIGVRNRSSRSSNAGSSHRSHRKGERRDDGEGSMSGTSEGTSITTPSVVNGGGTGTGSQYNPASVVMSETNSRGGAPPPSQTTGAIIGFSTEVEKTTFGGGGPPPSSYPTDSPQVQPQPSLTSSNSYPPHVHAG